MIPMFALPWTVIVPAMVARRARHLLRRPVPGPRHHPGAGRERPGRAPRAAPPDPPLVRAGRVALVLGFVFFSISGASGNKGGVIWLIPGLIALVVGIILVSPFFLALLARVGGRAPIAVRLPLRDMSRYRARLRLGALGHQRSAS